MIIDISKIKKNVINLEQIIDNYNNIALNLYNNFLSVSYVWNDDRTEKFLKELETNKINNNNFINELKSTKYIYSFLIDKYEILGNKIQFYLDNNESILNNFDKCIIKINKIINLYEEIDLSFDTFEFKRITKEKEQIINSKNDLIMIRKNTKKCLNYLEDIEKQIRQKIVEIDIEILKESETSEFLRS